jgi:hypothetical protein
VIGKELDAIIEGFVINATINFVKKYRYHWQTDDEGNAGEWKIVTPVVGADGFIGERVSGGYWIMHKVE